MTTIKKAVEQTLDSGIKPIVLDAQRVKNFSGEIEGLRTSLIVKSLALGTLTASEYRFVARRTKQANGLVHRNIEKAFYFYDKLLQENHGAKFITISVYARTLLNGELFHMLDEFHLKYPAVDTAKICLEMSADILFENLPEYLPAIQAIKQMGYKIALCEVGSEFCPILRLNEIPYDIVFLDNYVPNALLYGDREQEMLGLLNIISTHPVKIYGSCVEPEHLPLLEKIGVDGYTYLKDEDLQEQDWYIAAKVKESDFN